MGPGTFASILLSMFVYELLHVEATEEPLSAQDASFCQGGLKVVYPELEVDECRIVPKSLRKKISTDWDVPEVLFSAAQKKKQYVLVMVDPDAPRRCNPSNAHWQHWLVADIQGSSLWKQGQIKGRTLIDYRPPTPPRHSGLHRYQFMLFEQPPDAKVTLTKEEQSSRGKWDLDAFLKRVGLGARVATAQFLTQNDQD